MKGNYDVVVMGAGPAGIQAAIYLGRGKHPVMLVGKPNEGGLALAHVVENYFGIASQSGPQIIEAGLAQARSFGVQIEEGETVSVRRIASEVSREGYNFSVQTSNGSTFECKALVISTGSKKATAGIPREKEYVGKGLGYCAACDAYFFKGKSVAVVGSKDYAAHEALELVPHAAKVTIFTQGMAPSFNELNGKLISDNKVEVRTDRITEISGAPFLNEIAVRKADGSDAREPISGVFIAVGTAGSADLAKLLGVDVEGNFIKIDADGRTSEPGVFAAGDCTGGRLQLATSVGQGANAAFAAMEFLRGAAPKVDWG